ncbi:hypothetical protein [Algoriphagus namhaensis]
MDELFVSLKRKKEELQIQPDTFELIKALKLNRLQYNQLIKKAPYNWVAKISGFQAIK